MKLEHINRTRCAGPSTVTRHARLHTPAARPPPAFTARPSAIDAQRTHETGPALRYTLALNQHEEGDTRHPALHTPTVFGVASHATSHAVPPQHLA